MNTKKTVQELENECFDYCVNTFIYRFRSPEHDLNNLEPISPCYAQKVKDEVVALSKVISFGDFSKQFIPTAEDTISHPDDLVCVMILDYIA